MAQFIKAIANKVANGVAAVDNHAENNKKVLTAVFTSLMAAAGIFLIVELFIYPDLSYKVNWNMFESPAFGIMLPIAVIVSIIRGIMGKIDLSGPEHEYVEVTYKDGSKETYENNDVIDYLGRTILMPILGYLVILPIVYCALVYYPIVGLLALIGMALPYVISGIVVLLIILSGIFLIIFKKRGRGLMYWIFTLLLTAGILWGAIALETGRQHHSTPKAVIENVK